ncbi:probable E3 ubiquitin-protein ligase RHY1A isoform X2 [Elaeis guineensis]|uniref:Probable E3 ubiquitin-protein ligase RHY1A isoform X2 n=1 Tax=Elaeis guineensis var. tenera TaxID=51953 RepID=A0A6I9Q9X6_ELAGV|nr:probable E3 ubiquitin-protein ligase RHY1A isoform X2 [Elaeis guineensis]
MTSAAELFYNRRFRLGRSSEPEPALGLLPSSDRDTSLRHPRRRHGHRDRPHRRGDGCDSSRRFNAGAPPARHPSHHRASQMEHESVWLDNDAAMISGTPNNNYGGTASSRAEGMRFLRNDRLPGTVIQAQARLLERLRGISLTGSRLTTTGSGISSGELAVSNDFIISNSADWESETPGEWFESGVPYRDLTHDAEDVYSLQNVCKKKPPGLSWEAICSLQLEVFKYAEKGGTLPECSICLEKFLEGDELIQLCCGHRFHFTCLEPWVRACGDCPYCRASI